MEAQAARDELKRILKALRFAEKLDEVLATAETAEAQHKELLKATEELSNRRSALTTEIASLEDTVRDGAAAHEVRMSQLQADFREEQESAKAVKQEMQESIDDAAKAHEATVAQMKVTFEMETASQEAVLAELKGKIADARAVLDDMEARFKKAVA